VTPRHLWRIAATGISFSVFGIGGIALTLLATPVIWLTSGSASVRQRRVRSVIALCFRTFAYFMRRLGLLSFELSETARADKPVVIVANHPSLIDVVFLLGWCRRAGCVVKSSLLTNPFTCAPMRTAGYIGNEDNDLIARCTDLLTGGDSLVIFPEGTRTRHDKPMRFMRGAATMALVAGAGIQPVTIDVQPVTLRKSERWWQVPDRSPHYLIRMHKPWSAADFRTGAPLNRDARRLTLELEAFISSQLRPNPREDAGTELP
jgi:1-acyl-sn-glycerol-3-phosphate acyltransferase